MPADRLFKESEEKMAKSFHVLTDTLKGMRTGRATPALVEGIKVDYYGTPTPLKQLAQINVSDPTTIMIRPYDTNAVGDIEKGILKSDLGINPQVDGKILRLSLPPLSEERRKQMAAKVKQQGEEIKIAMRHVRRDAHKEVDDLEKAGDLTEDEAKRAKDKIHELMKSYEGKVDESVEHKVKELMSL